MKLRGGHVEVGCDMKMTWPHGGPTKKDNTHTVKRVCFPEADDSYPNVDGWKMSFLLEGLFPSDLFSGTMFFSGHVFARYTSFGDTNREVMLV